MAETINYLGDQITEKALLSYLKLYSRLILNNGDDLYDEFIGLFDISSAQGKQDLKKFLEDSKAILDDPASIPGTGPFPGNRGFAGTPANQTLPQGKIISRYGSNNGEFLADDGIPIWARSLPDGTDPNSLRRYEVLQPFQTSAGRTAPWFGKPGGGIQYDLGVGNTVQELLDAGILREIIQ